LLLARIFGLILLIYMFSGMNRPVCVVGNKVDLLPNDGKNFLQRVQESLREEVVRVAGIHSKNIKHVALVSAKTGFGIEQLVNKLHKSWSVQGDYLLNYKKIITMKINL